MISEKTRMNLLLSQYANKVDDVINRIYPDFRFVERKKEQSNFFLKKLRMRMKLILSEFKSDKDAWLDVILITHLLIMIECSLMGWDIPQFNTLEWTKSLFRIGGGSEITNEERQGIAISRVEFHLSQLLIDIEVKDSDYFQVYHNSKFTDYTFTKVFNPDDLTQVATIHNVSSLGEVYELTNSYARYWWENEKVSAVNINVRSTSVGDVIGAMSKESVKTFYIVERAGFRKIVDMDKERGKYALWKVIDDIEKGELQ